MRKGWIILLVGGVFSLNVYSQSTDDVLNLMVQKKLIEQKEADSIRVNAAILSQDNLSKIKAFPVNAGKKISLAGYTQVRYQLMEEQGKIDGFDIRRARLDLKGNISPYWGYRVQFDLAGTPKLLDAYVDLKLNDYFNFSIGQAKVPFSMENLQSPPQLMLINLSQVVEA